MRMTAGEQQALGVVDLVVPEPGDGAHTDHAETARRLRSVIVEQLDALAGLPLDELVERRYGRYRALGAFTEVSAPPAATPERPGLADRLRDLFDPGRWMPSVPVPGPGRNEEPPARGDV
jgi:hypothetical protein